MRVFRAFTLPMTLFVVGITGIGVTGIATTAQGKTADHLVVELADPFPKTVLLLPGMALWLVARDSFVDGYDWPKTDQRFGNPPPEISIELKATNPATPANPDVLDRRVIVDGLSNQDKSYLGIPQDDRPLSLFVAKTSGQEDLSVTITPKIPGKEPKSQTWHIVVQ